MTRRGALVLVALLALVPTSRADEQRGLVLAREARRALLDGQHERALELLEEARLEWPDSDEVLHLMADAYAAAGDVGAALGEYVKASTGPHAYRAHFNSGSLLSSATEAALAQAGVPLDLAGLSEDADPGPLIEAIDKALPALAKAREDFLDALALRSDEPARESVAALTERLDELLAMRDELKDRQQQQKDEKSDDGEPKDQDQQDSDKDQDKQDQQDGGDQDQQQPPPDQQPQDGEGQDEPADQTQQLPQPQPAQPLTAAERKELLDKLQQLEAQALALDRERRARERTAVEKDW